MFYVLVDFSGDQVDSFSDEVAARRALEKLAEEGHEDVMLLTYNDEGERVGEAVLYGERE